MKEAMNSVGNVCGRLQRLTIKENVCIVGGKKKSNSL
jgi:NADPH-dependent curcumin reductase CurA